MDVAHPRTRRPAPTAAGHPTPPPVAVTTRGAVPSAATEYAAEKVSRLYRYTNETVVAAHAVLTLSGDPARTRPAIAEVGLDFAGSRVRAQAAGTTPTEAVDLVVDRLRSALLQHRHRMLTRHRWLATRRALARDDQPRSARWVGHPSRPQGERELVRRKSFFLEPMSVGEAAFEMDLLGHEFFLFVDRGTGQDAVVRRTHEGYAVQGVVTWPTGSVVPVAYDGTAPHMSLAEAEDRLEHGGDPFVFFLDRTTDRGAVLYLRHDGHYGLIESIEP
ncbi:MAG: ribosome hibernation promotion factor [Nocardioides sp.]